MKNRVLVVVIIAVVLSVFSCKEKEEVVPVPVGKPLEGTFVVPDNDKIVFTMSSTDGFAKVVVNHEGKEFTFNNKYKMKEVNLIITSDKYYVRLKTYAKDQDTYVSYFLADTKESNIIYGYVGVVKRIK